MRTSLLLIISIFYVSFEVHATSTQNKEVRVEALKRNSIIYTQQDQKDKLLDALDKLKKLTNNKDYSEHFKLVLHKAYKSNSKTILKHYCEHKEFTLLRKSRICKSTLP